LQRRFRRCLATDMMRLFFICLAFLFSICCNVHAQVDTATKSANNRNKSGSQFHYQSAADSLLAKKSQDQYVADSISMAYLMPDPQRPDQFIDNLWKNSLPHFLTVSKIRAKPKSLLILGKIRNSRSPWVIGVLIALLIYIGLLNLFLGKDIKSVLQSFYNKHALSQLDKEGGLVNSWAFIGLFLLFCFTFGLFICQLTQYKGIYYDIEGFQLFLFFSVVVSILFALKFLVLKFLGFIFDINAVVSEYISVLNLTYFNIGFVFMAVALCFSLIAKQFVPALLNVTVGAIITVFAWQYLRNSVNIISNFRFHKFYLFIYLCALEICPVLILIKALDI
jgi:hypothetical protein